MLVLKIILIIAVVLLVVAIGYMCFVANEKNDKIKALEADVAELNRRERMSLSKPVAKKTVVTKHKDLDNVSCTIDHDAVAESHQAILDVLEEMLNDANLKKTYKDKILALRRDLLVRLNKPIPEDDVQSAESSELALNDKLALAIPELTKTELRLCVFLLQGMSTKEIAAATNREIRSVESSRNRLRKKLGLEAGTDIKEYILSKIG